MTVERFVVQTKEDKTGYLLIDTFGEKETLVATFEKDCYHMAIWVAAEWNEGGTWS